MLGIGVETVVMIPKADTLQVQQSPLPGSFVTNARAKKKVVFATKPFFYFLK
jgi:hypothetical protein